MWSSVASTRHINCGLPPEFFFVAPASSFQHHHPDAAAAVAAAATTINFDPHPFNGSSAIGVGVGVGVIPLLTATPCLAQQNMGSGGSADDDVLNIARSRSSGGMHLWQHQQSQNSSAYSSKKPMILDHTSLLHSGGGSTACGIGGSSSIGATTCQDCGNQAKKDCVHGRCRTCCKSRGYECVTHVRSTWVSASRRRERQVVRENIPAAGSSQSTSGTKKPRIGGTSQTTTTASHTSTSNTTPRSFDTSSSHQDASFKDSLPGQVRAPAVFKCVRVTALDDGEDEYAYQAIVKIGGHVFKGFLYDQGIEGRDGSFPNISELHLGGGGGNIAGRGGASSTQPVLHPTDILAAPGGGFLGGTSYGNPMN